MKESSIPGARRGVFAEKFIPEGVRFGPYVGVLQFYDKENVKENGYTWIVSGVFLLFFFSFFLFYST